MRISAYQFAVSADIEKDYETMVKAIKLARGKKIELVVFP